MSNRRTDSTTIIHIFIIITCWTNFHLETKILNHLTSIFFHNLYLFYIHIFIILYIYCFICLFTIYWCLFYVYFMFVLCLEFILCLFYVWSCLGIFCLISGFQIFGLWSLFRNYLSYFVLIRNYLSDPYDITYLFIHFCFDIFEDNL